MPERIDLFDSTYRHFTTPVLDDIRKATYGTDIGQNSWLTVDEYRRLLAWLELTSRDHVWRSRAAPAVVRPGERTK